MFLLVKCLFSIDIFPSAIIMHTQLRDAKKKYVKGNRMTRFYSFSYLLKFSLNVFHSCIENVATLPSFSTVDVAAL